ncbi:MAG: immunoglobulin domain-containing protein [Oligoflexia bacterium]|nr:immunoglobulin domain-containing protein [Oligoflexia bacterium]
MGIQRKKQEPTDEIFRPPRILREPGSKESHLGGKIALRVVASGFPLPTYQWFHNGKKMNGAASDRLIIQNARKDSAGTYHCEVKNLAGRVSSRPAMISILSEKINQIIIEPAQANIPLGKVFSLRITEPDRKYLEKYQIQWFLNGKKIKGATGNLLQLSEVKLKYQGKYKVILTLGSEIISSNECNLSVLDKEAQVEEILSQQIVMPNQKEVGLFFNPEAEEEMPETKQEHKEMPPLKKSSAPPKLPSIPTKPISTKLPENEEPLIEEKIHPSIDTEKHDHNENVLNMLLEKKASVLQKFTTRFENLKNKKAAS